MAHPLLAKVVLWELGIPNILEKKKISWISKPRTNKKITWIVKDYFFIFQCTRRNFPKVACHTCDYIPNFQLTNYIAFQLSIWWVSYYIDIIICLFLIFIVFLYHTKFIHLKNLQSIKEGWIHNIRSQPEYNQCLISWIIMILCYWLNW